MTAVRCALGGGVAPGVIEGDGEGGVMGDVTRYWVAMPASSIKIEVVLAADYDALRRVAERLRTACRAQHEAIDRLFARLIETDHSFRPSGSGQPWDACVESHKALAAADAVLGK